MNEEENNTVEEQEEVETPENELDSQENDDNKNIDGDKTVDKLKQRLSSKTAENHDLKHKYEEQSQLLDDLKSGRKSIKELASDDKKSKEETEKDNEITKLKAEITRTKAINDTNTVFKEQGLVVNDDVLNMVVGNGTDNDAIYENVKALTDLINSTKDDARKEFMKGSTPRISGKQTAKVSNKDFDQMTLAEKVQLHANNPEKFNQLTGGIK
ncbi:capsid assembly scaffolding protein Gp46 family protein [Pediococcus pentosaceus]|uniref:capsid assembly scaffolding protein Gp46 family protein n=1 Tax=Pediococcus pentosaceus TaxID=1255 RepID=UPI00200C23D0|nr:DUF4355 domain-containing protein [Pediococcus pentosaceus]MDB1561867.1 DUF4355 domain-containing protein [Pediococcus pentosaceus]UQA99983.1 DUF4355 domain-containing protein [Pediococcus pentosaceus]UQB01826.1 DUF4355 domain-containing protein [Pediococcus pentosaceus]